MASQAPQEKEIPHFALDSDSEEEDLIRFIVSHGEDDFWGHEEGHEEEEGDESYDEEDSIPLASLQWSLPPDPIAR